MNVGRSTLYRDLASERNRRTLLGLTGRAMAACRCGVRPTRNWRIVTHPGTGLRAHSSGTGDLREASAIVDQRRTIGHCRYDRHMYRTQCNATYPRWHFGMTRKSLSESTVAL